jgi:RNA polymerase sigma-70 factor (ECF subfamily)
MPLTPAVDRETTAEVARLRRRDPEAVRAFTTANNQRLFRAAWAILKDRAEAEDAVQTAYLKAFAAMGDYRGDAALSTWLTRILINEALERRRRAMRARAQAGDQVVMLDVYKETLAAGSRVDTPDAKLAREQIRRLLEGAIADLPEDFRLAFVLGDVEGLSTEAMAELLGVPTGTVKTRRLRARRRLREALGPEMRAVLAGTFPFAGADCEALSERIVAAVCAPGEP